MISTDQILKEMEDRNWDEDGHGEKMLISDDLPPLTKALRVAITALERFNDWAETYQHISKEALSQIERTLNGETEEDVK